MRMATTRARGSGKQRLDYSKAEQMLRNRSFDLIVCTVFFDESRMFDLLRMAKSTPDWQCIPFVCARLRPHVLETSITREAVAFTCKAMGAAAFLDVTDCPYPMDTDRECGLRSSISWTRKKISQIADSLLLSRR